MESVLGRYRNLTILVGVLFLQVLGLAVQVKRSANAEHTRLIRIWAVGAITPFERGLVWAQNGSNNLWHNYFFLRGVRAENRQLKEQIEQMRLEQVRLSEDATQAHRLQSLLAFKEQYIAKTVPAQVIGSSGSDLSRSIYIDKGENAGLKPDMAVITAGGIVGKVWIVYPSTSLVLMINDQSSGVGTMVEKTRLQGVVRGTPDGELILDRVMSDESVSPGETLLSSGGDRIFPKGLPVGIVSKVSPGKEMFLNIHVKPAADLSRVEEVLVVTDKQEREPLAESGGTMRAADILAQRLPSVPDKPAAPAVQPGTSQPATAAATGQASGAIPKPPLNSVGNLGTAPRTTGTATAAPGTASAAHNSATLAPGSGAPVSGLPSTGEVLKQVVQKSGSENSVNAVTVKSSAANGSAKSTASPAGSTTDPASASATSPAPAKPATARPKVSNPPASTQTRPQTPASEDSPH
jgi:rod shape-determining protein MreC